MSEYFKNNPQSSLGRIYVAHTIEKELEKLFNVQVRALMKLQSVVLVCPNQAQATVLTMNRPKIYGIISRLGGKSERIKIVTINS